VEAVAVNSMGARAGHLALSHSLKTARRMARSVALIGGLCDRDGQHGKGHRKGNDLFCLSGNLHEMIALLAWEDVEEHILNRVPKNVSPHH
jgi:hypothetical protein